jgi:hypothetical protein
MTDGLRSGAARRVDRDGGMMAHRSRMMMHWLS